MNDLETQIFYRLIKVSHVFFITILSFVPIVISVEPFINHHWVIALMILVIGFSASYLIPTLIKHSLLYIVYGTEIVYWSQFIATTSLIRKYLVQAFKHHPKTIYSAGICIFYVLAFLIDDSFFTVVGFWILAYPLFKVSLLCKRAFIDKDYIVQDKLWDILENTIGFAITACGLVLYITWKDPKLYFIFELILKYMWNFFIICCLIYIVWLLKKALINRSREALKDLFWSLIGGVLWTIIFYFYDVIKSVNFHL